MGGQVSVDADLCIGSGDCVRLVPTAFAIDDETNVSQPLPGADAVEIETLVAAARNCPTNAIEIRDAEGAVLVASAG